MAGGTRTIADQFFRSTLITGNRYVMTGAQEAATVDTTIGRYATLGLTTTRRFRPTQIKTTEENVPAVGAASAGEGWESGAVNATSQTIFNAGDWTVSLRCLRTSGSGDALTTVIVYRVVAATGAFVAEVGRAAATHSWTTTATDRAFTFNPGEVTFNAGEAVRVEVYTQTVLSGIPTPPASATDHVIRLTNAVASSRFDVFPAYLIAYARSHATALTLAAVAARQINAARTFTTALTLSAGIQRRIIPTAKTAALSLTGTVQKRVVPLPFTTALSLTATAIKAVVLNAKTTAMSLTASMTRQIAAARSFTTALTLGTVFARSVNSARGFTTALILTARGRVDMAFEALSRISGGAAATVRKIFIFDD